MALFQMNRTLLAAFVVCGTSLLLPVAIDAAETTVEGQLGDFCRVAKNITLGNTTFDFQQERLGLGFDLETQPEVASIIKQVDIFNGQAQTEAAATLDSYDCSTTSVRDGEILIHYAVCNSEDTPLGCYTVSVFRGKQCASTSLCATADVDGDGDADPTFTADCSGINDDYPNCKVTCSKDETDSCGLTADLSSAAFVKMTGSAAWVVVVGTAVAGVLGY